MWKLHNSLTPSVREQTIKWLATYLLHGTLLSWTTTENWINGVCDKCHIADVWYKNERQFGKYFPYILSHGWGEASWFCLLGLYLNQVYQTTATVAGIVASPHCFVMCDFRKIFYDFEHFLKLTYRMSRLRCNSRKFRSRRTLRIHKHFIFHALKCICLKLNYYRCVTEIDYCIERTKFIPSLRCVIDVLPRYHSS